MSKAPETLFVRHEMLAQKTPPVTERGIIKWLRENLFSGLGNTVLTILGLAAIYYLIRGFTPWLSNSVWNAESYRECRDIVIAQSGEGATGACWAMVRVRWNQFLFGLYPVPEYWRPVTVMALLLVFLLTSEYLTQQTPIR